MLNASAASIKAPFYQFFLMLFLVLNLAPIANAKSPLIINSNPFSTFSPEAGKHGLTGNLKFVGGFSFTSEDENVGGFSGLRILNEGGQILSVSDQGRWLSADIERDGNAEPIGFTNATLRRLRDKKGNRFTSKRNADAEGLEIVGNEALVSFERNHRILHYSLKGDNLGKKGRRFRPSIRKVSLPNNNGLEAIVALNPESTIKASKATIAVFSEHSLDTNDNIRGFVSGKNGKWDEFTVKPHGDFKLTDAVKLDETRILLLERRFSMLRGAAIQIRLLATNAIKKGALLDGPVVFEADMASRIDNLEGISVWQSNTGETRVSLISDNNFSALQSNLYLEFQWIENPAGQN